MKATLLLVLLAIPAASAYAQQPGPASAGNDRGWFSYGLGPGWPDGFSGVVSAHFGRERILQFSHRAEGELLGGAGAGLLALEVGRSCVNRYTRVSASAGPALISGKRASRQSGRLESFTTGGLNVSAQAIFTPVKEMGLGLDLFGTLHPKGSLFGICLTVVLEGNK